MNKFIIIISSILIIATLLPLLHVAYWWVRMLDFPHLQVAFLMFVTFILAIIYRNQLHTIQFIFLGALFICFIYKLTMVYPYTPIAPKQTLKATNVSDSNTLSLLISNIYMENRESEKLLSLIDEYDPHIVLVMEPDEFWEEKLRVIEKKYPYHTKKPLSNTWGMLLYSKLEFVSSKVEFLTIDTVPSIYSLIKLRTGDIIELNAVHPVPPTPFKDSDERDAELVHVGKRVSKSKYPSITAGDLNDVAWSYTTELFQKTSGTLDPRRGRGFYNTFSAKWPFFSRYPLDHIFHTKEFRLVEIEKLKSINSDHFPMYIKLSFEPEKGYKQKVPPMPDKKDREQLDRITNQEKE